MGFPKLPPLVAKSIPCLPGHEDDIEFNTGRISEVRDDSALSSPSDMRGDLVPRYGCGFIPSIGHVDTQTS